MPAHQALLIVVFRLASTLKVLFVFLPKNKKICNKNYQVGTRRTTVVMDSVRCHVVYVHRAFGQPRLVREANPPRSDSPHSLLSDLESDEPAHLLQPLLDAFGHGELGLRSNVANTYKASKSCILKHLSP